MKAKVYNQEGVQSGELELNSAIFEVKTKAGVVHQVYNAIRANNREPWADTKGKGEVRGGGRKPWKQKGTGRARHGSIRSPIWKGGGVTFGPLSDRNYKQKVNKTMNQKAVKMSLSDKLAADKFIVLEDFKFEKTKTVFELLTKLKLSNRNSLMLVAKMDETLKKATRNLPKLILKEAKDVNVSDLLNNYYLVVTKDAVNILEKRLA